MNVLRNTGLFFVALVSAYQVQAAALDSEVICPMVYKPAICSYENFSAEGTNSCFAYARLATQLKAHGIEPQSDAVVCEDSLALMKSKSPVCGILPTTTYCTVTVDDKVFSAYAHDCESPIPSLRQQLFTEKLSDRTGLKAFCERSQLSNVQEYTVDL